MAVIAAQPHSRAWRIASTADVGEARRGAVALAMQLGFAEADQGRVAIVATELATNLALHGGGGTVLATPRESGALDLASMDAGRGMADVARCLSDGYSTAGTAGNGLGAIKRLAQAFDIHSEPGAGTIVYARLHPANVVDPDAGAGVALPMRGESVSGDAVAIRRDGRTTTVLVVDGLGHGSEAAHAANAALLAFRAGPIARPQAIVRALHAALRATRGAAVAVFQVDAGDSAARYCGLGNIAGAVVAPGATRGLMSHNGIAGHTMGSVTELAYEFVPGSLLVLHSDGINTRWSVEAHPGLLRRLPGVVATLLLRDHQRGRDDASVLVLRA